MFKCTDVLAVEDIMEVAFVDLLELVFREHGRIQSPFKVVWEFLELVKVGR